MNYSKKKLTIFLGAICILVIGLSHIKYQLGNITKTNISSNIFYTSLPEDNSADYDDISSLDEYNPLLYLDEDFTAKEGFHSNLPLVVLELDEKPQKYKDFSNGSEVVLDDVEPYVTGSICIIENQNGVTTLQDKPSIISNILIKKRGHTSISFDKSQYYIRLADENGEENPQDILSMGIDDEWILNGSMADKSMMRNYIAYRTAAEIMEYAPRSSFCEMFTKEDGKYVYQGVYLMMDSVKRSKYRVNIDSSKDNKAYSSYLVRRDRFSNFDTMLDTYGRLNGYEEEYIGVKYPSLPNQSKAKLSFIESDFSKIEKILYSKNMAVFGNYDRYIDTDTFVDYFLINEYFGNYDAGLHSTYMYKNSGDRLKIGPVWDFDQAMNNSVVDEADPLSLAMQEKAFYKELCQDTVFIDKLKNRYSELQADYFNDDYMFGLIDETSKYLSSARAREWYRWSADYLDDSHTNPGNYYLENYNYYGENISRFNDNYDQEIYNIKVYLSKHGKKIQPCLTELYESTKTTTGVKGHVNLILFIICVLFLVPSVIINRK